MHCSQTLGPPEPGNVLQNGNVASRQILKSGVKQSFCRTGPLGAVNPIVSTPLTRSLEIIRATAQYPVQHPLSPPRHSGKSETQEGRQVILHRNTGEGRKR